MSRRGKGTTKFSLFAFQDIITSVTGIMILVTLLLSIELLQRKEMSPSNRTAQIVSQMTEAVSQVDQLEAQFNSASSMLADLTRFDPSRLRSQVQDLHELNERMQSEVTQLQQQEQQTEREQQRLESEKQRRALDPQTIDELNRKIQEKKELRRSTSAWGSKSAKTIPLI